MLKQETRGPTEQTFLGFRASMRVHTTNDGPFPTPRVGLGQIYMSAGPDVQCYRFRARARQAPDAPRAGIVSMEVASRSNFRAYLAAPGA